MFRLVSIISRNYNKIKRSSLLSLTLGPEQLIGSTTQQSSYLLDFKQRFSLLGKMYLENETGKSPLRFVEAFYFPSCQKLIQDPLFNFNVCSFLLFFFFFCYVFFCFVFLCFSTVRLRGCR